MMQTNVDGVEQESAKSRFWIRSMLVAIVLLSGGVCLAIFNALEVQSSRTQENLWPHKVLRNFAIAWFVTLIVYSLLAFVVRDKLVKSAAIVCTVGAILALLVNAYQWMYTTGNV